MDFSVLWMYRGFFLGVPWLFSTFEMSTFVVPNERGPSPLNIFAPQTGECKQIE